MASEKNVSKIIKELGFEPKEHACIVVKYAPDDSLCGKLSNFFTLEYYIMQLCEKEIVFLPLQTIFGAGMFPKKEIALQIPYDTLRSVKITEVEKTLNYEVSFTTDTDTIRLSVHKKEWSEFRTSGTVATGNTFLNIGGFAATKSWKSINWHRQNLDNTFSYLQNLPQSAKSAETVNSNMNAAAGCC